MIFERLAKFVVKKYVILIIAWIVVLFYVFPTIFTVNDVVSYQETEFLGKDYESQQAGEIISEQFPSVGSNSSMILVIFNEDLTTPEYRDAIIELKTEIEDSSELRYFDFAISIYDVYMESLTALIAPLAPNMTMIEQQSNLTLQLMFGIPEGYFVSYESVNQTASMIFGIPSYFFNVWTTSNDTIADTQTRSFVSGMTTGMDPLNASMIWGYYDAFNQSWAYLGLNPLYLGDPLLRLNTSIDMAVQAMASMSPPEYSMLLTAVHGNLTLGDFANAVNQSIVSYDLVYAGMAEYLSDPMSAQFALGILDSMYARWMSSLITAPTLSAQSRLNAVLPMVHSDFISIVSSIVPQEQLLIFSELSVSAGNFGLSNYTDPDVQHSFMLGLISEEARIYNYTFLEDVYALGSYATNAQIEDLAWKVIKEGTIGNYPLELPASIKRSFINDDNNTMLLIVSFTKSSGFREADGDQPIVDDVDVVRSIAGSYEDGNSQLQIYVTGEAPISADLSNMTDKDISLIEPVTISMVLILMGLFFRAVLGPVVPLASIGIALGLSQAVIVFIGIFVANVHFTVLTMVIAILFGVGTDYSIFILARYREELLKGASYKDAMQTSITWAGESIATSGATVVISFSVLSLSSFSMLQTMGLVLGMVILIALLVALTLVPSIALLLKGKLFWPMTGKRWEEYKKNYKKRRKAKRGGYFRRAAKFSTKHAILVFAVAILISLPTTYLFMTSKTSYDFIGGMGENDSVQGLEVMSESFGAGRISPTEIVIQFDQPVLLDNDTFNIPLFDTIENVSVQISSVDDNVFQVVGPTRPNGDWVNYTNLSALDEIDRTVLIMQIKSFIGEDNRTVRLQAIFVDEPYTTESLNTAKSIRTQLAEYRSADQNLANADAVLVGGSSAGMVDVDNIMSVEFSQMEIGVIIGVFVVLLIVLGSVILPLFAILSIGLSISWTLAATLLVFGELLTKPVLWLMPVVLFVILMGLGMDYNIFILTRIREEAQKRDSHEQAIVEAVDRTGGIITACALIMAGAFGTLMISGTTILQEFGFALSFAVLLDAMLVRTYITPAILKILGPRWTWWAPGKLQRVKPEQMNAETVSLDDEFEE
ncbi:MAG: MMPL family transporter [Thermoplasmata archaeon]|nr:MMPL family transporter [Thermoplasmata archaeon]